jgi:Tol biopolymer transport system component
VIDMRPQRSRRVIAAALAVVALPLAAGAQSPGVTTRASVSSAGVQGDGFSSAPSVSEDGRLVAFSSGAGNLVPDDGNGVADVFVRDRLAQTTERVSVASDGSEANGGSGAPKISRNGRFIAFASEASDLVPGDGNGVIDVFVHDRDTGETERVSRAIDGGDPDARSFVDSISDDGTLVGFWSDATNLVDDDGNDSSDSFVFDRETDTTERVSVSMFGGDADHGAIQAVLSGDGRFVAFVSGSKNLVIEPMKDSGFFVNPSVFVRDRVGGATVRVSEQPNGRYESGKSGEPSISRDGRFVAYTSTSKNLTLESQFFPKRRIHVTDLLAGETELVVPDFPNEDCPGGDCRLLAAHTPSISADGRFVAFMSSSQLVMPANPGRQARVYVADRVSGVVRRISVDPSHGVGSLCSVQPAISGDGRVVAYRTTSDDLVADDSNAASDVLVSEWACPNTGAYAPADALPASCEPVPVCPTEPDDGCAPPRRSSLRIATHPPGASGRNRAKLDWNWRQGLVPPAAFGDPTDASGYTLCVYGGPRATLQLEQRIDPGAGWRPVTDGFAFDANSGGVERAILRGGRHARIRIRGSGAKLGLPYLPLDERGPLLVRLHRSDGGCFAADYAPADVRRNSAAGLSGVASQIGRFVARVP